MQRHAATLAFLGDGPTAVALAIRALQRGIVVALCDDDPRAPTLRGALEATITLEEGRPARLHQVASVAALPPDALVLLDSEGHDAPADSRHAVAGALDARAVLALLLAPVQSLATLATRLPSPERVVGVRMSAFWGAEPLAEVVANRYTAPWALAAAVEALHTLGCTVVPAADLPGLVAARLLAALQGEAVRLAAEGVPPATIDRVLAAAGISEAGPFAGMERLGMCAAFSAARALYAASFQEPRYRPHPLMARLAAADPAAVDAGGSTESGGEADGPREGIAVRTRG